jgi:predicted Zn-dependent protease with MMP-like domain
MTAPDTAPDTDPVAPDLAAFEDIAQAALESLPPVYAQAARGLAIRIEDFAPDAMLREMDIDNPFELTGLYDGIPLTEKSVMDQPMGPDTIWLFRRPILDEWADRGNVGLHALIAHVLVHELAHHFGWSDDDIAAVDPWWE